MGRRPLICALLAVAAWTAAAEPPPPPATVADWRSRLAVIANPRVRVAADACHGGRLVEYALDGRNALYAVHEGDPDRVYPETHWPGPLAGRFDIGPEETVGDHPQLWNLAWTVEKPGPLHLRLTSPDDAASGLRLVRDFVLDAQSTRLRCTQTMTNISPRTLRRAYWGRSLAPGGGIVVTALTPDSRFPHGWLACHGWPRFELTIKPKDPAVTVADGFLTIRGTPKSKVGLDTLSGWMAYLRPDGLLFAKRFATFPGRRYADIPGLTQAFWYGPEGRYVELEPLGPEESLAPGASASFSEDWWLLDHPFPAEGQDVDPGAVQRAVDRLAVAGP